MKRLSPVFFGLSLGMAGLCFAAPMDAAARGFPAVEPTRSSSAPEAGIDSSGLDSWKHTLDAWLEQGPTPFRVLGDAGLAASGRGRAGRIPSTPSLWSTYFRQVAARDDHELKTPGSVRPSATEDNGLKESIGRAYQHLGEVMDKYNRAFDVYTDQDAGGNHYIPSGWMGDWRDISFNGNSTVNPHGGTSAMEIRYSAKASQGNEWAGIYFQYPENNWGDKEGGYDLAGATKLTFWARGKHGGEKAEFKVGGINRHPYHDPGKPYQDSLGPLSTGIVTLTPDWKQYAIDLVKDEYFAIYTDNDAGGNNHYVPSGWYNGGGNMTFDGGWTTNPHSGSTCIKIAWNGKPGDDGAKWNGIMWQQPENNWQGDSGLGHDLRGASKLRFWARTDQPGLKLKLLVGYPDDSSGEVLIDEDGWKEIGTGWKRFEIDLTGKDLSDLCGGFAFVFNDVNDPDPDGFTLYLDDIVFDKVIDKDLSHVIGGFCWVTDKTSNPDGATIYLDDIRYDKKRLEEPHLLTSYEATSDPEDVSSRNAAHIYDNALAMLAFMARGTEADWRRAGILADSFVHCMEHDRHAPFNDGRLRNVYMSGDLVDQASGHCRLPGWWDYKEEKWLEDKYHVSSYTGNLAWVMIGLLRYYEAKGGQEYRDAAVSLGSWIHDNCHSTDDYGGYTGGWMGWEPSPENPQGQVKIKWKSTEHNIDVFVAFMKLHELLDARAPGANAKAWKERALHARAFVEAMWDGKQGHFWTGTSETGEKNKKRSQVPEDVQSWGLMALRDLKYAPGIEWVEKNCLTDGAACPAPAGHPAFLGFDFNRDKDGIWWEGTAHMCLAYQILGKKRKAVKYLSQLREAQVSAERNNQKGMVAACRDRLTTGFTTICEDPAHPDGQCPWYYYNRLHIGATAWYIFAGRKYEPYWGERLSRPE